MVKDLIIRYDAKDLVEAARMIKINCKQEEICGPNCAFWSNDEVGCIFKARNKYHGVVDPEDWEV